MIGFTSPADALRARGKLGPYTVPAGPVPAPAGTAGPPDEDPAVVRAWAAEHGIEVAARGRVPADVLDRYREAHR